MKKGLVYFLGIVTGVVLTLVAIFALANKSTSSSSTEGVDYFAESQIQTMGVQSYKVFQVLPDGNALASCLSNAEYGWYMGPAVLLLSSDEQHFYDEQKVSAPKGKKFMQVGTYRYETKDEMVKTVPAVALR